MPPLVHEIVAEGARDGAPVVLLLHGRGADEQDLAGLAAHLPAGAVVVLPRAPFPGAPWGYGPGWAWYRFLGGARPEPESFGASQDALDALVDALPALLPVAPGPLVLGGFSQGGTMSLAWALRHPGRAAAVLNFSGFLPEAPGVAATAASVAGTAIFWGHGADDPAIPHHRAVQGQAVLRAAGAELEACDYPIGHWIDARELADATRWLERVLRRA
jgi:phospholipase/carboxylesterase